jgi:hypothetical protein
VHQIAVDPQKPAAQRLRRCLTDASGFNPARGSGCGLHRRSKIIAGGYENQSAADGRGSSRLPNRLIGLMLDRQPIAVGPACLA